MRPYVPVALLPVISGVHSAATCASPSVDLSWYPSPSTDLNSLNSLENSSGIYGFVFNSSADPAGVPYGTYNWCNMPHVRSQEYKKAPSGYKLEYVEVVSTSVWKCSAVAQLTFPPDPPPPQADTVRFQHVSPRVILMGMQRRSPLLLRSSLPRRQIRRDQLAGLHLPIQPFRPGGLQRHLPIPTDHQRRARRFTPARQRSVRRLPLASELPPGHL
jgi:hypothetical protein